MVLTNLQKATAKQIAISRGHKQPTNQDKKDAVSFSQRFNEARLEKGLTPIE